MLPGSALGPPGELTGAAWLHSPWFDPSWATITFGWRKVLQVFVFGGLHGKRTGKAFVEKSSPKKPPGWAGAQSSDPVSTFVGAEICPIDDIS